MKRFLVGFSKFLAVGCLALIPLALAPLSGVTAQTPNFAPSPADYPLQQEGESWPAAVMQNPSAPHDSIGLYSYGEQFAPTLWQNSQADAVEVLMKGIRNGRKTLDVAHVLVPLLASPAEAPQGYDARRARPEFFAARAKALYKYGQLRPLRIMLDNLPEDSYSPDLKIIDVAVTLFDEGPKRGCPLLRETLQDHPNDSFLKGMFVCQLYAGQTAEADLTLSLLREYPEAAGTFMALAERALRPGFAPRQDIVVREPDIFEVLVLGQLNSIAGINMQLDENTNPAALGKIALMQRLPLSIRTRAGELAAQQGLIPLTVVRALYGEYGSQLAGAMAVEEVTQALPVHQANARLWHAAQQARGDDAKLSFINKTLLLPGNGGQSAYISRLYRPVLEVITPTPAMQRYAPLMARLLYAAESDAAETWLGRLQEQDRFAYEQTLFDLWPHKLWTYGAETEGYDVALHELWRQNGGRSAVVEAYVAALQPDARVTLSSNNSARIERLQTLLRQGKQGEALLVAASLMQRAEQFRQDPQVLTALFQVLRANGLAEAARILGQRLYLAGA